MLKVLRAMNPPPTEDLGAPQYESDDDILVETWERPSQSQSKNRHNSQSQSSQWTAMKRKAPSLERGICYFAAEFFSFRNPFYLMCLKESTPMEQVAVRRRAVLEEWNRERPVSATVQQIGKRSRRRVVEDEDEDERCGQSHMFERLQIGLLRM
jgi:hypothetical protein